MLSVGVFDRVTQKDQSTLTPSQLNRFLSRQQTLASASPESPASRADTTAALYNVT